MGCFIGCFRVRDDRAGRGRRSGTNLVVSDSSRPKLTEVMVSQNRLSSLFVTEDNSPFSDRSSSAPAGTPNTDKQLKNEAKFLKACGTLAETPIEIRKASSKLNGSPIQDGGTESAKFHSWLPSTSIKKLQLEKVDDQPATPTKASEARTVVSGSLEQTPSSCVSNQHNAGSVSVNSAEGSESGGTYTDLRSTTKTEYKSKSVRFECDLDTSSSQGSSSEDYSQHSKKANSSFGNKSMSRLSPYPTPLKLSDKMQTPGTVFPSNLDNGLNGKTRIRSQYVYPVLNPLESVSQWSALKEEDLNSDQVSVERSESLLKDPVEHETPRLKESIKEDSKVEASLSAWLKPVAPKDGNFVGLPSRPCAPKTPAERPIIGTVAAHWNDDEPSRISPKWWDGNGIPNSTNKYKEDQKVSWHATPFEERLEKALSEESIISQRKPVFGTPIVYDETEEGDSALSQLKSSSHQKSVVSF